MINDNNDNNNDLEETKEETKEEINEQQKIIKAPLEIKKEIEEKETKSGHKSDIEKIVTVEYIKNTKGQKIYDVREIPGIENIDIDFRENNSDNIGLVEVSSDIETAKFITDAIESENYKITALLIPYGSEEYIKTIREIKNDNNK